MKVTDFWAKKVNFRYTNRLEFLSCYVIFYFAQKCIWNNLVKYWVDNYVGDRKFGVESPDYEVDKILINHGYATLEADQIVGQKCFFVYN